MKEVFELIKNEDFEKAENIVEKWLKEENEELKKTRYYYLLAYINSDYKNKNKNLKKAKRYIKYCINSDYSEEQYYVLYKRLESDKIIFESVIRNAILKYPNSIQINMMLFDLESNKGKLDLLEKIKSTDVFNESFVMMYLAYFFSINEWDKIYYLKSFINESFNETNLIFINLVIAISLMLKSDSGDSDLKKAKNILEEVIRKDTNNQLENNSYIILLYCNYLLNDNKAFNEIVNKLPLSCKYFDLINYPYPIEIDFKNLYKFIFPKLISFSKDKEIKNKISAIYSLYLFSDYKNNFEIRFTKKNINNIEKVENNFLSYFEYCGIVCTMYACLKEYRSAVLSFLNTLSNGKYFFENIEISFGEIINDIDKSDFNTFSEDIINYLENVYIDDCICENLIKPYVDKMFRLKLYNEIFEICKLLGISVIKKHYKKLPLFEFAYSSRNHDIYLAKELYELAITNKESHASLNNLGTIYEELGYISKASELFNKAFEKDVYEEIYRNNTDRIAEKILLQSKAIADLENQDLEYLDILLKFYLQRDRFNSISLKQIDISKFENLDNYLLKKYFNEFVKKNYLMKYNEKIIVNMTIYEYLLGLEKNIQKNKEYKIISDKISFESLNNIGYNNTLMKQLNKLKNKELINILKRDIKECAISYVSGQYKSTIVLGGSIIESLLTCILKNNNINSYSFPTENGKSKAISLDRMGLEQLLQVCNEERLIDNTIYHLNQYVREYRNAIHPSVEIRKKIKINEENATMTWNILKETIKNLK